MKKSLLSLVILSGMTLSHSAIAANYTLDNKTVTVNGNVTSNNTCLVAVKPALDLDKITAENFVENAQTSDLPSKKILFTFEKCSSNLKNVKVSVANQDESYFKNTAADAFASKNVTVGFFSNDGKLQSVKEGYSLSATIDEDNFDAIISIPVNYYKTDALVAKPGQVIAPIVFNVEVDDNEIVEIDGGEIEEANQGDDA